MEKEKNIDKEKDSVIKLGTAKAAFMDISTDFTGGGFYWDSTDVDKFHVEDLNKYKKVLELCRFFYQRDPLASTVVNKLIEIGITDLEFFSNGMKENEFRAFEAIKRDIQQFIEECALEYLLTGLVIPEIHYTAVKGKQLRDYGIKKKSALTLPTDMWVRDSATITIKRSFVSSKSSYFVEVPDEIIFFIKNEGKYSTGEVDKDLYEQLLIMYPEFVKKVNNGETKILLDNPLVIERRRMSSETYPIPYLYPALESLKHKRNLRKMDYSIASRVISAIQLVKLGDKDFPLVEENEKQLEDLRTQMLWRDSSNKNVERVFQLFGNHTLNIEWVYPNVEALLSDSKYDSINKDILYAFGFPRILVTGEVEKTGTSDASYAMLSPIKTMDNIREKLEYFIQDIIDNIVDMNKFSKAPLFRFKPINLTDFSNFFEMLTKLYEQGNISRDSLVEVLGYNWTKEADKRLEEQNFIEVNGLEAFSPVPHSNVPDNNEGEKVDEKDEKGE